MIPSSTPFRYRDVFEYVGSGVGRPEDMFNNNPEADRVRKFWEPWINPTTNQQEFRFRDPYDFNGAISYNANKDTTPIDIDWSKLPSTRFGSAALVHPVDRDKGGEYHTSNLINPNLIYEDPNYGAITLATNIKENNNTLPMLAIMGAMAAFGAPMAAGIAASAGGGALGTAASQGVMNFPRALASGDMRGFATNLALGAAGMPGWASSLARMALNRTGGSSLPTAASGTASRIDPRMLLLMALMRGRKG